MTAAVMLLVLTYHGVQLGPQLFVNRPELAYRVFATMLVSYLLMLFTIMPLTRYLSRIVLIPTTILVPVIVAFTLVGAFAPRAHVEPAQMARRRRAILRMKNSDGAIEPAAWILVPVGDQATEARAPMQALVCPSLRNIGIGPPRTPVTA